MLLLLAPEIFFFYLRTFKYSKPELGNLTNYSKCYSTLALFSHPSTPQILTIMPCEEKSIYICLRVIAFKKITCPF